MNKDLIKIYKHASIHEYCSSPGLRGRTTCFSVLTLAFVFKECFIHQSVIVLDDFEYLFLTGFNQVTSHDDLFKDKVCLMKIEDEVKFTHVAEVSIQNLHEMMDYIQHDKFIIVLLYSHRKIQTCIPTQ